MNASNVIATKTRQLLFFAALIVCGLPATAQNPCGVYVTYSAMKSSTSASVYTQALSLCTFPMTWAEAHVTLPGGRHADISGSGSDYAEAYATITINNELGLGSFWGSGETVDFCWEGDGTWYPFSESFWLASVSLNSTGSSEVNKPTHFLHLKGSGNATITATLNPSGANPNEITWSGGTAGSSNLQRLVSLATAGTTTITATTSVNSVSVVVHVVDATAPPTAGVNVTKTFSQAGTATIPAGFGYTTFTIGDQGIVAPTYSINPHFEVGSGKWFFRLASLSHSFKLGVRSHDGDNQPRIDLPNGNPSTFPLYPNGCTSSCASLTQAHSQARADFDTTGIPSNFGPRLDKYYANNVIQNHEQAHVDRFYATPSQFWLAGMDLFESDDVEASSVFVVFDCNNSNTITGSTAIAQKTSTWNTAITGRHNTADTNEAVGSEVAAHAISNQQFMTIRGQIPSP